MSFSSGTGDSKVVKGGYERGMSIYFSARTSPVSLSSIVSVLWKSPRSMTSQVPVVMSVSIFGR